MTSRVSVQSGDGVYGRRRRLIRGGRQHPLTRSCDSRVTGVGQHTAFLKSVLIEIRTHCGRMPFTPSL
jgi:hypothetical protein